MKIAKVSGNVPDTSGLFFDLVESGFEVLSISVEKGETLIRLEMEEEKDPSPIVELWIDRPAEKPSRSTMDSRRKIYEAYVSEKPERMNALRARLSAQQEVAVAELPEDGYVQEYNEGPVQILTLEPTRKKSAWSKLAEKLRNCW